jgi:hypothetical protein
MNKNQSRFVKLTVTLWILVRNENAGIAQRSHGCPDRHLDDFDSVLLQKETGRIGEGIEDIIKKDAVSRVHKSPD